MAHPAYVVVILVVVVVMVIVPVVVMMFGILGAALRSCPLRRSAAPLLRCSAAALCGLEHVEDVEDCAAAAA